MGRECCLLWGGVLSCAAISQCQKEANARWCACVCGPARDGSQSGTRPPQPRPSPPAMHVHGSSQAAKTPPRAATAVTTAATTAATHEHPAHLRPVLGEWWKITVLLLLHLQQGARAGVQARAGQVGFGVEIRAALVLGRLQQCPGPARAFGHSYIRTFVHSYIRTFGHSEHGCKADVRWRA